MQANGVTNCQNCKKQFAIEPADFDFYEKIKVPPPTFCPECRLQRRMAWRNERSLYKRKCGAPGHTEEIISMYNPAKSYKVYDSAYWWSDAFDATEHGKPYDFSKPFFVQFAELMQRTPQITLSILNSVNCDYTNFVDGNKNCYLVFGGGWNENVRYGNKMMGNKDSQDLLMTTKCELSYECVNCVDSYRLQYSANSKNCSDSYFLYSCRNCTNCFGCANLVNKSYCIFNTQYSKEEYFKKLKEFRLGDYQNATALKGRFFKDIYMKAIHRCANIFSSSNCTGDNIINSKNCINCFDIYQNIEDSKYLYSALDLKDSYDGNGVYQNDLSYEYVDANTGAKNLSGVTLYNCTDVRYSWNCHSSSKLFGCVGLRSKEYCILNKQYSEEEYKILFPRVLKNMEEVPYKDAKGRIYKYGEFFPIELSPFSYNETITQEYFTLTAEEAAAAGYPWKEKEKKNYIVTLGGDKIPSDIETVNETILKETLGCDHGGRYNEQCTEAFKIIGEELQFYKRLGIPLPRLCPNCRHYGRLKKRNPLKLWHRACQCAGAGSENGIYKNSVQHVHGSDHCPNEFETSYPPERPEIVYCEQCYRAEVV